MILSELTNRKAKSEFLMLSRSFPFFLIFTIWIVAHVWLRPDIWTLKKVQMNLWMSLRQVFKGFFTWVCLIYLGNVNCEFVSFSKTFMLLQYNTNQNSCKIKFTDGIYLLKVNNRNTGTRCEICSKYISHLVLVFLLLTLNI